MDTSSTGPLPSYKVTVGTSHRPADPISAAWHGKNLPAPHKARQLILTDAAHCPPGVMQYCCSECPAHALQLLVNLCQVLSSFT